MSSMLTGCDGLPGCSSVLLCNISLGDGRCGAYWLCSDVD